MTVLRGERKPGKKWSAKDRTFALALQVYEADLCNGCGKPLSVTAGDHRHDYEPDTTVCVGCEELEKFRDGAREPAKGEKTFLVKES